MSAFREFDQERAYMLLRMNGGEGSDYVSSDGGSYEDEEEQLDGDPEETYDEHGSVEGSDYGEDAFDANESGINPEDFDNDEAYARALQDAEERDVAVRLMALAGLNDCKKRILDARMYGVLLPVPGKSLVLSICHSHASRKVIQKASAGWDLLTCWISQGFP
ncbi:E3 ubiquitin ligase BIG BROTHER-related [Dendrobium catenatum]|uniref:E3 ubiquitin ligase BIG BROTHER-related n=1 Tax=Dendrobium catenatum TaxID=906689 RepID=A0A2I0VGT1_9ASPA|nr:E3 ubiquitin ligase BIG BROTHER-related [Dendrobium catenatum]